MIFRGRKSLKKRGRKQNRTYKRGGKFIGKGAYGCMFRPALLCKGDSVRQPGTVTKLMTTAEAELEYGQAQMLAEVDPAGEFFIRPTSLCEPQVPFPAEDGVEDCQIMRTAPRLEEGNTWEAFSTRRRIIQMPDGGHDLYKISFSLQGVIPVFSSIANLFEGLKRAHSRNITHNDIKMKNIVVREEARVIYPRFIDYGFLFRTTDLVELVKYADRGFLNYEVFMSNYRVWGPEVRLANPNYIQRLVDNNFIGYKDHIQRENPTRNISADFKEYKEEFIKRKEANENSLIQLDIDDYYRTIKLEFPEIDRMYSSNATGQKTPFLTPEFIRYLDNKLKAMPITDRHTFIFKQNDVFGLGVTLLDMLDKLTKKSAYHSIEFMRLVYNKLFAPYMILIMAMTNPDPFERISLDVASDRYNREVLPIIQELFSEFSEAPLPPPPPPSPASRRNTPTGANLHNNLVTLRPME
jgi:serine/threonine protein kinase